MERKKLNHYDNRILFDKTHDLYVMGDWEDENESKKITCRNGGHILDWYGYRI